MEPLTVWRCDTSGECIENVSEGHVIWRLIGAKYGDCKIIHKARCDPEGEYSDSMPLESFLGHDGLAMLLSWLNLGPLLGRSRSTPEVHNLDEFVDFVRRVQTLFYEEARQLFSDEDVQYWLADANPNYPYLPETLKQITAGTLGRS